MPFAKDGRLVPRWMVYQCHRYKLLWGTLLLLITEKHYAQIHPEYRDKAREYAKLAYASDVTYKV